MKEPTHSPKRRREPQTLSLAVLLVAFVSFYPLSRDVIPKTARSLPFSFARYEYFAQQSSVLERRRRRRVNAISLSDERGSSWSSSMCLHHRNSHCVFLLLAGDADLANKVSARRDRAGEELVLTLFCFFLLFMMGAEAKWSLLRYCVMYFFFSLMPSTTTAIHRRIGGRVASLSHRYLFWRYRSFSFSVCFRLVSFLTFED